MICMCVLRQINILSNQTFVRSKLPQLKDRRDKEQSEDVYFGENGTWQQQQQLTTVVCSPTYLKLSLFVKICSLALSKMLLLPRKHSDPSWNSGRVLEHYPILRTGHLKISIAPDCEGHLKFHDDWLTNLSHQRLMQWQWQWSMSRPAVRSFSFWQSAFVHLSAISGLSAHSNEC